MDFRSLQYFAAIARHGNLTKAAESLYVGQPTLSKFLMALEEELGLKLFQKVGQRYMLTYAGELYLEKAREILRLKDNLDAEMADIVKQNVGVLNVAFAHMRSSYMLPIVLPAFRERRPNVKVQVFEGSSDINDRRLLEGAVELAFYSMPSTLNPRLTYQPLAKEELLICTRRDHPVRRFAVPNPASPYPKLDLSLLKDELVLMMLPEQRTRQIVDSILRRRKIQFENVLCTANIQAIIGLVSSGYGVSFVFDTHLKHSAGSALIDCYSFGEPRTQYDFVAASRKGGYLPSFAQDFIETVRQSV